MLADADLGELSDDHAPPVAAEEVLAEPVHLQMRSVRPPAPLLGRPRKLARPPSTHLRARESRPGVRSCRCPAVRQ